MLNFIWNFINKDILYEDVLRTSLILTIAKKSLVILNKNIEELNNGIEVKYKYYNEAEKYQNFLTPFGGKNYRMEIYNTIETQHNAYNILIKLATKEQQLKYKSFEFNINNKKKFLEDNSFLQLLYLMYKFKNKKGIIGFEVLTKSARRCNYYLAHLGSISVNDFKKEIYKNMFNTNHYKNIFTVEGFSLQAEILEEARDYYFDINKKIYFSIDQSKLPDKFDYIPF